MSTASLCLKSYLYYALFELSRENVHELQCSTVSGHRHATLVTMEKVLKNIKLREGLGRELRDRDVFDGG